MMKLKEIAAQAGVSPSTVSLVIHRRPGVSAAKREEILQLLLENGYDAAQGPAWQSGAERAIRFIKCKRHAKLVDGNPGFINMIIDAVGLECRRQGYELLITTCTASGLPEMLRSVRAEQCAGILLLGTELTEEDLCALPKLPVPLVLLDNAPTLTPINCITMDNRAAMLQSAAYLRSLGHSEIGFLANALPSSNCLAREAAYREAMEQAGAAAQIYRVAPTPDGAYKAVRGLLAEGVRFPSALLANTDSIALGAIKALREAGLRIPQDVSVIGFDNIPLSGITDPPLSTMEVPCKEMGIWATRLLCDCIQYPFAAAVKMQICTRLLPRGSTAPRKKDDISSGKIRL